MSLRIDEAADGGQVAGTLARGPDASAAAGRDDERIRGVLRAAGSRLGEEDGALVQEYAYQAALRVLGRRKAGEGASEILAKVLPFIGTGEISIEGSVVTYFCRVLRNVEVDKARKPERRWRRIEARDDDTDPVAALADAHGPSTSEVVENQDEALAVTRLAAERDQRLLQGRADGLSYEELEPVLDDNANNLRQRWNRLRKKCAHLRD